MNGRHQFLVLELTVSKSDKSVFFFSLGLLQKKNFSVNIGMFLMTGFYSMNIGGGIIMARLRL